MDLFKPKDKYYKEYLTLKAPITTAADNNFFFSFYFFFNFLRKQVLTFHMNHLLDSQEMSRLVFSEKKKN